MAVPRVTGGYAVTVAPSMAAMSADEMLEQGDMDGQAAWLRIMKVPA